MNPVGLALLGAAILHVFEEYGYPGGFSRYLKGRLPVLAPYITPGFSIVINTLLLASCAMTTLPGAAPVLVIAVPSLLAINALLHIAGTIHTRRYVPGVITAVALYLPLSAVAFYGNLQVSRMPVMTAMQSLAAGVALQLVPVLALVVTAALNRR